MSRWIRAVSGNLEIECEDSFEVATHYFLVTVEDTNSHKSYNGKMQDDILVAVTINPINLAPFFKAEPEDVELEVEETFLLGLSIDDPDSSDVLTITATLESGEEVPSFITTEGTHLKFMPLLESDIGTYTILL